MMRAPVFTPSFVPVHAYQARFSAPDGPNLASTIGRVLVAGGADLGQSGDWQSVIQAIGDDTAGRARALQDRAAVANLIDTHGDMQGGAAVAAQPLALGELDRIQAAGQAALGSPDMIAAYDQQMGPAIDDAKNRITSHSVQQMAVERQAVADQTMQAAQQSAASAWQDPARFGQGLATVHALAVDQTGLDAGDEQRAAAARAAVGGTVADAFRQALAAGEPQFAAHIVGGWGDTLSPADYQQAVARLGQVAQTSRMGTIFAQAAGGNPAPDAADALTAVPTPATVAVAAPVGAAVHPIAGGMVTAIDGAPDSASVRILHPDGSSTTYGGFGQAAVAPGDLVTTAHVIGSASPVVTMAATTPSGDAADAGALLRNAGGTGTLIGAVDTPRTWDRQSLLDNIVQREDISPDEQALARNFAIRRMAADQALRTSSDLAAGRAVVGLAAVPGTLAQVADLPQAVAAQMTPTTLAQVDSALRNSAQAPSVPAPDNAEALRLELMQRQYPNQFARINLAPLIGTIHPLDLSQLANSQARIAAGQAPDPAQDPRSAVLDALARHEFINGVGLPDDALPAIKNQAETLLRLDQTAGADRSSIDNSVSDAIQSQVNPA